MVSLEANMRPLFKDREIINLAVVITSIKFSEDLELLKEYQEEVAELAKNQEIRGLEVLSATLSLRIEELSKEMSNNENSLEILQKQNPSLSALSIVQTSKEKNDSKKDIEYIKYVNENGVVRMLECASVTMLNDFLRNNPELALNGNVKEIFNYFKNHMHASLSFHNFSDETITDTKESLAQMKINDPRINDENAFTEEKRLIEEYSLNEANNIIPRIAINSKGERIYTVGETVIAFSDDHGKRKMEIISSGNNLEKEEEKKEPAVNIESSADISSSEQAGAIFEEDKPRIGETAFNNLLGKLYNGEGVSIEEKERMYQFAKDALDEMQEGTINYDRQNSIDLYIEYLTNQVDPDSLTETDKSICNRYKQIIEDKAKAKTLAESLEDPLKLRHVLGSNTNGMIISIVILEGTILLGILISVLALVKR